MTKCIYVDRDCAKLDCMGFIEGNEEGVGDCVVILNQKVKFFATLESEQPKDQ